MEINLKNIKNSLLFRNRNLFIFWMGQLTSRIGSYVSYVALLLLVNKMTGRSLDTAITGICEFLPGLVLGLWAGAITDRIGKVKIMIITDIMRAIAALLIPVCIYFNCLEVWHLYLCAVIISIGTAFFQPAEMAIIPDIVEKEDILGANAISRTTIQLGGIIGPALGAIIITAGGSSLAFLFDGATFVISAICLILMKVHAENEKCGSQAGMFKDIKDGINLIWQNNYLKAILLCCIAVNFTYYPLPVLLPKISQKIFIDIKFLNSAMIFAGFITALTAGKLIASLMIHLFDKIKQLKFFLYYSNIIIAVSVIIVGVSPILSLSYIAMFILGFCGSVTEVRIVSYIQSSFSENILGRIFSIILTVAFGTIPLSLFLAGALSDNYGTLWVIIGLGILLVITSLIIFLTGMLEKDDDSQSENDLATASST
jgi:MFS family permease